MRPFLLFPHQLFGTIEPLRGHEVWLIEAPLFLTQFRFHVQKLILHRASMKAYEAYLLENGMDVRYVEVDEAGAFHLEAAVMYDAADDYLLRNVRRQVASLTIMPSPNFLGSSDENLLMHRFYIHQRKRLGILVESGKPAGGQWSFDAQNRKKLPEKLPLPKWKTFENPWVDEARVYVRKFKNCGGGNRFYYPVTFEEAHRVLSRFVAHHLPFYGDYQDAMTPVDSPLFHAMLSSSINLGLLTPSEVVEAVLKAKAPLNAKEGFIRQIIGWREFMRRTYDTIGARQRTTNFFGFTRKMPSELTRGRSGLLPFDDVMKKVDARGYAHHIERLMVLGNLFLLLEIDPDDVYAFFMANFIDAYDWVMVGNVYGMSQYADGGLITTKPYICSSNYLLKMSRYKKGEWCAV